MHVCMLYQVCYYLHFTLLQLDSWVPHFSLNYHCCSAKLTHYILSFYLYLSFTTFTNCSQSEIISNFYLLCSLTILPHSSLYLIIYIPILHKLLFIFASYYPLSSCFCIDIPKPSVQNHIHPNLCSFVLHFVGPVFFFVMCGLILLLIISANPLYSPDSYFLMMLVFSWLLLYIILYVQPVISDVP